MAEIVRPSWMNDEQWNIWFELYLEAGGDGVSDSAERATTLFRENPRYETWFPGIRTEEGNLRYPTDPEATYQQNMQSFRNTVEGIGLNADVFDNEYIDLITGDVSPSEFGQRVNALEARVMNQGPGIRDYYANQFGVNMTRQGIMASLMSERVEQAVFDRNITMAEIGGEGADRGYDLQAEFVEQLAQTGMDRGEAQRMFGTADRMLGALQRMAERHGDPDDTFDIYEFAEGVGMDDATQLQRMETLQAQEASQFTGGAQIDIARDQRGGVAGLRSS